MEAFVFLEKVRAPEPRGLARARLESPLTDPASPPLALVLGPPGSGKTTLLSRAAALNPARTAWYRATSDDEDEAALVRHLGYAIGATQPEQTLVEAASSGTVSALVAALDRTDRAPLQLIVDDLHEIAGTRAELALDRLLALRPRHVRILMSSRRPPLVNTSRLLVSGDLSQLDGGDLRFRSWEVEDLFRVVYERPLSPEAAAALTRRTGGWAAGLTLFHLATSAMSRLERERAVAELSGRSLLIRSYLARNVLDGLDDARRDFLLRTCTLGVLTGELCDTLLGTTGSAAVLHELEAGQFFTTSTDGGLTFRYHQVLQTHLEVVLQDEVGGRAARQLYAHSAALLEAAGHVRAAVRAHARAEDWGQVARLLQQSSSELPGDEDYRGMSRLPGAAIDDPGLTLAEARRLLRDGRVPEAVAAYRQAESLMDDPDFRSRCVAGRAAASLWLPHTDGHDLTRPAADRGLRLSRELRQLSRDVRDPHGATTVLARGVAHLLAGSTEEAVRVLTTARSEADELSWERLAVTLTALAAELGRPEEAAAGRLEEIVLSADVAGLPWLSRIARGLQVALLLAVRPTPWRVAACQDLVEDCERQGDQWALCLLTGAVGAALVLAGHNDLAEQPLRRAEASARELDAPVLQVWAVALRALATGGGGEERRVELARDRRRAEAVGAYGAARMLDPAVAAGPRSSGELTGHEPAAAEAGGGDSAPFGSSRSEDVRREPGTSAGPGGRVRLSCLGAFALTVDGIAVGSDRLRPRARSLLMMLALHHGRDVHRERLIDALWPDANLESGTRSLQVATSSVRQALLGAGLSAEVLRRRGDSYALTLPDAWDQVAEFERLVREASRQEAAGRGEEALQSGLGALEVYAGDLLPEVGPAEWVLAERDRLRGVAAGVAAEAARLALLTQNLPTGVRAARRAIELERYRDLPWLLLSDLYDRLGDHAAAAVTRLEHARVCADLGLPVPAGVGVGASAGAAGASVSAGATVPAAAGVGAGGVGAVGLRR